MTQFCVEEAAFAYVDRMEHRAHMSLEEDGGVAADPVAAGIAERQRVFAAAGEAG